ncbi:MAG: glycosyltransferase [Bdellovibrionota bacterium]
MSRILVFSPVPTHPQTAGHRARIAATTRYLREMGNQVGFVYLRGMNQGSDEDLESMQADFGPSLFVPSFEERYNGIARGGSPPFKGVDDWYDDRLSVFLKEVCCDWRPDVLWVNYVALSKIFEDYPGKCLRVLDTHDVFSERKRTLERFGLSAGDWYEFESGEEIKAIQRAHITLAITWEDAAALRRLGASRVFTLGHLGDAKSLLASANKCPTILYFASGGSVNALTLQRLCQEVFPQVLAGIANARLLVAGKVCKTSDTLTHHSSLELLGPVTCLTSVLERAGAVCNPEIAGSGISIKNLTTLSCGVPLVTTPAGARGLRTGYDQGVLVAEDTEGLAAQLVRVLTDNLLNAQLRKAGQQNARRYFAAQQRRLARLQSIFPQ